MGIKVEIHRDYFQPDGPDTEWLELAGKRNWVVLFRDKGIRRRPIEKQALIQSGVRAFVLASGNLRGHEMAELLVRHLRKIERLARKQKPPFIASITQTGVQLLVL